MSDESRIEYEKLAYEHGLQMGDALKRIAVLEAFVKDVINNAPTEEPNSVSPRTLPQAWGFWVAGQKARRLLRDNPSADSPSKGLMMDYESEMKDLRAIYASWLKPHQDAIEAARIKYEEWARLLMLKYGILNPIVKLLAEGHQVTRECAYDDCYLQVDGEYPLAKYGTADELSVALMNANDSDLVDPIDDESSIDSYELTDAGREQYESWKRKTEALRDNPSATSDTKG